MIITLVNCHHTPSLHPSEMPLLFYFKQLGIDAQCSIWNDPKVDWTKFDALIVRSLWDYHKLNVEFNEWLDFIEINNIRILNSVSILRKNQHKFYLKELAEKGIPTIPTCYINKTEYFDLKALLPENWARMVIKPAISASAYHTSLFSKDQISAIEQNYQPVVQQGDFLVQAFVPEIQSVGELSMLFFNRTFVYAILKTAKDGDFRVQADYGGVSKLYIPSAETIMAAAAALTHFEGEMLYARVDGVLIDGRFVLMEVELLEPLLFLDHHPKAYEWLVKATIDILTHDKQ